MAEISTCPALTRESVMAAHKLVKPHVHYTPVLTNTTLNDLASTPRTAAELDGTEWAGRTPARPKMRFYFKCENLQRVGAFKVRGAFHALERLAQDPTWDRAQGVVTHSSGNHAQALALAARTLGARAHIVMPAVSQPAKIAATKGYGAEVVFSGSTAPEREAACARVARDTGARLVPPYDHPDVILGQGTLGLELLAQARELIWAGGRAGKGLDAVVAPCGGGGMLSGVALSCDGTGARVFGAEPSFGAADDARRGFAAGQRVEAVSSLTIADGLRTPLGVLPWGVIYERRLVAGFFAVSEEEIKKTLRLVLERMKMVVEPSGVVPLAVALWNEDFRALVEKEGGEEGWDVGIVFSGGNVSVESLAKLFS